MYLWLVSDSHLRSTLIESRRARSDAMSRGFYLVIRGVGRLFTAAAESAARLGAWLAKRNRRRLAIATLRGLDDRLLSDIGIGRSEILGAVKDGERHPPAYRDIRPRRAQTNREPAPRPAAPSWKKAA